MGKSSRAVMEDISDEGVLDDGIAYALDGAPLRNELRLRLGINMTGGDEDVKTKGMTRGRTRREERRLGVCL